MCSRTAALCYRERIGVHVPVCAGRLRLAGLPETVRDMGWFCALHGAETITVSLLAHRILEVRA
jgi:hypothetical protein